MSESNWRFWNWPLIVLVLAVIVFWMVVFRWVRG